LRHVCSPRKVLAMTYSCPLNDRECRCDPGASDEKFHPCMLARRIGTLVRLMGSNFEGEAIGAVTGLRRLLPAESLTFSEIAILIENCNGKIETKKYSDTDAEIIFTKGVEKGRGEGAREQAQIVPADFYDVDGHPRWNAIAMFCQNNHQRLGPKEQKFIDDMAGSTMWRAPTEGQRKWLLSIFVKLKGRRAA
jgi:hypothetical protein